MFSRLHFLLLLVGISLGFAHSARASHAQGGSLTYTYTGGNSYRVRADLFRDCSGISAPASLTLQCQTSCGTTAISAMLSQVGQPFIGTPYNSAIQPTAVCPLNGPAPANAPANYAAYRYEGTVTLAPNQWILSVEESVRPTVANITAGTLRLEATLDSRGRVNNSVMFNSLPTIFVPVNQSNLLHISAFDLDGDSLSYALERPLSACATYETYLPSPNAPCQTVVDPRCPSRIINCTGVPTGYYSQFLPISVARDTVYENGTTTRPACPVGSVVTATVVPRFSFSTTQGTFAFMPNRYVNTPSANGDNKYVAVVKITEWRRENGAYVAVGTTRRDLFWVVYNGGANTLPRLAPTVTVQNGSQSTTQALTAPIAVRAGEPIAVSFAATTAGSTPLAFTLEQNTVPGALIQPGTAAGSGRLTFTPPLSLPDGTYRVSVSVSDDAAPLRNLITVPVTFRVYRTALATRAANAQIISAYPTPFTGQVRFQLPTVGVQPLTICDNLGRVVARLASQPDGQVQWSPAPSVPAGLYAARSADGKITVRLLRTNAL